MMPIIGMLFFPMYLMINAAFCGRLGKEYLAGLGLGSLTISTLLMSIGICFSMTTSSLVTPAFGAGDIRFCRVILNRQYFLNTLIFAVTIIPFVFLEDIYRAIGQKPEVAKLAATYAHYCAPGVYFSI